MPSDHDKLLEIQIEEKKSFIENSRYCCLFRRSTDMRLLKYVFQCSILSMTMMFSMIQLSKGQDKQTYLSLLTLCLGVVIPNPKVHD